MLGNIWLIRNEGHFELYDLINALENFEICLFLANIHIHSVFFLFDWYLPIFCYFRSNATLATTKP